MHHGTCSDYNQYCPNARLNKPLAVGGHPFQHHQHQFYNQQQQQHYLLGNRVAASGPFRNNCSNSHQSQQALNCAKPTATTSSAYQPLLLPSTAAAGQFNSHFRPPCGPAEFSTTTTTSSSEAATDVGGGNKRDPFNFYRAHLYQYFYQPSQHGGGGGGGGVFPVLNIYF